MDSRGLNENCGGNGETMMHQNTDYPLPPQPPRWHFWLARLLGRRQETYDWNCTVTGYWWRKRFYVTSVRYL
jgi:hypothetical protein